MIITYIGHSCFLLQTARHRLLIDPGEFCAPADAAPIAQDAGAFARATAARGHQVLPLKPGASFEI